MKQSKQVLGKNTAANYQEGRKGEIFSALARKIDTGLPPNAQIEIGCHVNGVESLFQLFECCF